MHNPDYYLCFNKFFNRMADQARYATADNPDF